MSHVVVIKTKAKDLAAIAAACQRLQLPPPTEGTAKLFGTDVTGIVLRLPDWLYPVVIDVASGDLRCDTYFGAWGDPVHLDRFLQAYAVEATKLEGRRKGYSVIEQPLRDGSIQLQLVQGG